MLRRRAAIASALTVIAAGAASRAEVPRTLTPGVLRVGTYFVNPPFEYLASGVATGFEVDLMAEIARQLGLRVAFVNAHWATILEKMQNGQYDCVVGGITITPVRERALAWSVPYLTTTLSLVVNTAKTPVIRGLADMKDAVVGVQAATTDEDAAETMMRRGEIAGIAVYPFDRIEAAMADLAAGRITAVMKVAPVAAWLARQRPGLRIVAQVPDDPQPLGIGFGKSDPALVAAVDAALAALQRNGAMARLERRWNVS